MFPLRMLFCISIPTIMLRCTVIVFHYPPGIVTSSTDVYYYFQTVEIRIPRFKRSKTSKSRQGSLGGIAYGNSGQSGEFSVGDRKVAVLRHGEVI